MTKFLERLLQAFQAARRRQARQLLSELDPHTLRDIGFGDERESARLEAVRRSLRFGLY
jgi:uncharacterized protein YjiS (DUF1127 family)